MKPGLHAMSVAEPPGAAMIYQYATRDRDQAIAKALGTFVKEARGARKQELPADVEPDEEGA